MPEQDRNALEILAAEYVLGTLWGEDRRAFEARVAGDATVRDLIAAWQDRLRPLGETDPEVVPSAEVWQSIEKALGLRRPTRQVRNGWLQQLWENVVLWRWASFATAVAAVALAAVLVLKPADVRDRYVAVLDDQDGRPAWLVSVDLKANTLAIRPVKSVSPGKKSYELWALPGAGRPPRSIGLLNASTQTVIRPPPSLRDTPSKGYTLAISLEPEGGSPTGLPTGPVVFQGVLLKENP